MADLSILHLDGTDASTTYPDTGSAGYVWTNNGAELDTAQSKFGSASLLLDGSNYIESTDVDTLGPDSWVVDFWYRYDDAVPLSAATRRLFAFASSTNGDAVQVCIAEVDEIPVLTWSVGTDGTSFDILDKVTEGNADFAATQWNHIAIQYDHVNDRYSLHFNGTLVDFESSAVSVTVSDGVFRWGVPIILGFSGHIDEGHIGDEAIFPSDNDFTPFDGPYGPNVTITMPMLTLASDGIVGAVGTASLHIPVLTMDAFATVLDSAFVSLPMFTLASAGHPIGSFATADIDLPRITLDVLGGVPNSGAIGIVLPMLTLLSNDDIAAYNTLPMLTLLAEGAVGAVGSAILTLPMLTLAAQSSAPGLYLASNTLPMFNLNATGISGALGTMNLVLPRLRLASFGLVGTAGVVNIILPSLTLFASEHGTIEYLAGMTLPMLQLVATGYQAELGEYRIWALNMRKGPLTEYTNFNFNSFANFGGRMLAAGPTGIRVLDASMTDDGDEIAASVRWGNLAYGTSFNKRIPRIYIGHRSDGYSKFTTATQGQGTREYLLPGNGNVEIQQRRVQIGKGPKSTYWQFGYENVDGSDFAINSLILRPDVLRRRVF